MAPWILAFPSNNTFSPIRSAPGIRSAVCVRFPGATSTLPPPARQPNTCCAKRPAWSCWACSSEPAGTSEVGRHPSPGTPWGALKPRCTPQLERAITGGAHRPAQLYRLRDEYRRNLSITDRGINSGG